MTPGDMARVLAKMAAFDQRTVGQADVLAWHEAVGHHPVEDAMAAVTHHYAHNRDRMWPVDLTAAILDIRRERAGQQHHEIRALPSKYEPDEIRDARVRAGVAQLRSILAMPETDEDDSVRGRALARARRERGRREMPQARVRRDTKPIDLAKVPGPDWATPEARERSAADALHSVGRPCGKPACTRDPCKAVRQRT